MNYRGRWGDEQYPDSDKRQQQLVGNRKYVGGPTGPADKQLGRKEVWPESQWSKGQKIRGSLGLFSASAKEVLGKLKCFGKKGAQTKVLVSGEVVK